MNLAVSKELMRTFINRHPLAVLSTVDTFNHPHGTTLYTGCDIHFTLYFLTKSNTLKASNIDYQNVVALTFSDEQTQSTLQLTGGAVEIANAIEGNLALDTLRSLQHDYTDFRQPLSKLNAGNYILYKIVPTHAYLTIFGKSSLIDGLVRYDYRA